MKKHEFESATLDLWVDTAIPLTAANLQYYTGVSRRRVRRWLEAMTREGVVDMDCDDAGELVYVVPGAERSRHGPRTFEELARLRGLGALPGRRTALATRPRESGPGHEGSMLGALGMGQGATRALAVARSARQELERGPDQGKKSLLVSGGLSLFLGPLGWLYAGSLREAIPAGAAYVVAGAIIPKFLLLPILGVAMPISCVAGLVYAWHYNRTGQRGQLFARDSE